MAGCKNAEAIAAARGIIDFMYQAHMPELSEADLDAMDRSLEDFHDAKHAFVDAKKGLLRDEDRFNDIPKIHMLSHYTHTIRLLGTPDGFNTEATERLHIDYVKEAWDVTNHGANATQQMTTYLQRQEAWALLRAYLHDTGQLPDEKNKGTVDSNKGEEDVTQCDIEDNKDKEDIVGGESGGDGGEGTWYPTPQIAIAKRPALGTRTGTYIMSKHGASDLIPATVRYLSSVAPAGTTIALSKHSKFKLWSRFKLRHPRLPFAPRVEAQVDQVRASPRLLDNEGRIIRFGAFDVVLVAPSDDSEAEGLHRFQAGRVRAIFELPNHLLPLCSEKLAYVELFRPFSANVTYPTSLYTTGHMMRDNQRAVAVVPISKIRMACHLAPRYHLLDPDQIVSSSTDLLAIHNSFLLNRYTSHFQFAVMDYWEAQRQIFFTRSQLWQSGTPT
ncbi:hypothetical protein FRC08_011864 [Ceratobasidium sp. 394]|nr:hypothetical protein FRC08_011864 [Ceratobasidium sp. 394]